MKCYFYKWPLCLSTECWVAELFGRCCPVWFSAVKPFHFCRIGNISHTQTNLPRFAERHWCFPHVKAAGHRIALHLWQLSGLVCIKQLEREREIDMVRTGVDSYLPAQTVRWKPPDGLHYLPARPTVTARLVKLRLMLTSLPLLSVGGNVHVCLCVLRGYMSVCVCVHARMCVLCTDLCVIVWISCVCVCLERSAGADGLSPCYPHLHPPHPPSPASPAHPSTQHSAPVRWGQQEQFISSVATVAFWEISLELSLENTYLYRHQCLGTSGDIYP